MSYENTLYFNGDAGIIIELTKNTFLPLDFEIASSSENSIELKMSYFKTGFHDNPLVFISRICISIENKKILIKAYFGNDKINTFLVLLTIIGLQIFFIWEFGKKFVPIAIIFAIAWIPWIPFIIKGKKSKINASLDTFCNTLMSSEINDIQS